MRGAHTCIHHTSCKGAASSMSRSVLQTGAVVGRQTQVGTRAGYQQRYTHRRVTSAPQRRPTKPHNDNQLNTPTRATTGNPPTRVLHVHQTRTPRMQHFTFCACNICNKRAAPLYAVDQMLSPLYTLVTASFSALPTTAYHSDTRVSSLAILDTVAHLLCPGCQYARL